MAVCELAPTWVQLIVVFFLTLYILTIAVYTGNWAYRATLSFIGEANPPDWKILLVLIFLIIVFFVFIRIGLNADALKIVKNFNFSD